MTALKKSGLQQF
jgi:hypothetical protein